MTDKELDDRLALCHANWQKARGTERRHKYVEVTCEGCGRKITRRLPAAIYVRKLCITCLGKEVDDMYEAIKDGNTVVKPPRSQDRKGIEMNEKEIYEKAEEITQKGIDQYEAEKKQKEEEAAKQPMDAKTVYEQAIEIAKDVIGLETELVDNLERGQQNTKTILDVARTIVEGKRLEFYERGLEKLSEMMAEKQSPAVPFPSASFVPLQQFKPGGKFFGSGSYPAGLPFAPDKEGEPYPEMPPTVRGDFSLKAADHIILYRSQYGSRMVILYDSDEDRDTELKRIKAEEGMVIEFYHTAEAVGKETLAVAQRLQAAADAAIAAKSETPEEEPQSDGCKRDI